MKHLKLYENNNENLNTAKRLAKLIGEHFFSEVEEFDRVVVEEDNSLNEIRYIFRICFAELYKETIEQIEKFNVFFGYKNDGWNFLVDNFTFDDVPKIYVEFYIPMTIVDEWLNELGILEKSKKFNL